jgi:hypothetical protein
MRTRPGGQCLLAPISCLDLFGNSAKMVDSELRHCFRSSKKATLIGSLSERGKGGRIEKAGEF